MSIDKLIADTMKGYNAYLHSCDLLAVEGQKYIDCDDEGLDGESFRENLDSYVYANHYDEHTDDVYTSWQLNHYDIAKKVLKELKNERK